MFKRFNLCRNASSVNVMDVRLVRLFLGLAVLVDFTLDILVSSVVFLSPPLLMGLLVRVCAMREFFLFTEPEVEPRVVGWASYCTVSSRY